MLELLRWVSGDYARPDAVNAERVTRNATGGRWNEAARCAIDEDDDEVKIEQNDEVAQA